LKLFIVLIPVWIILIVFTLAIALIAITRRMLQQRRRNPLTREMLRNPGESLREKVEDLGVDLDSYLFALIFSPFLIALQILFNAHFGSVAITHSTLFFFVIMLVGFILFFVVQIVRIMRKKQSYRLGMECEMAVGQGLNQLMLLGCRVYHDFPAEDFNIDHIVIGPAGVYAVETKGRAKPDKDRGKEDANVNYDGKSLQFPGWTETEPIAQAKRQAQWLASWLSSAVGQQIPVHPALALPGWYIERKARDMVVFNSKNPQFLAKARSGKVLSDEMIQRISHQVEQRCRTVEPISYKKKKKKK
jgi:hypothetical protein